MPYDLEYVEEALEQLRALRAADATNIARQVRRVLGVNPTLESKARIKRLVGGVFPPFRLRVDEYRVFYEVEEDTRRVVIWGVKHKSEAAAWLVEQQRGDPDADEIP